MFHLVSHDDDKCHSLWFTCGGLVEIWLCMKCIEKLILILISTRITRNYYNQGVKNGHKLCSVWFVMLMIKTKRLIIINNRWQYLRLTSLVTFKCRNNFIFKDMLNGDHLVSDIVMVISLFVHHFKFKHLLCCTILLCIVLYNSHESKVMYFSITFLCMQSK